MMAAIRAMLGAMLIFVASGCSIGDTKRQTEMTAVETSQSQQLYLFQYSPGPAWQAGVPMKEQGLGGHARYMLQLQSEGRLFAGGGYASDDGGMAVVMAKSADDAQAMLAADPAITSGIFVAELRQWVPRFRSEAPLPPGG